MNDKSNINTTLVIWMRIGFIVLLIMNLLTVSPLLAKDSQLPTLTAKMSSTSSSSKKPKAQPKPIAPSAVKAKPKHATNLTDATETSKPPIKDESNLYDISAVGMDIRYVLEALAKLARVNIVVSPEISGEITAQLKQLPLEVILNNLSAIHGFAWKKDDNTFLIASKERFAPPPEAKVEPVLQSLIWECKHIKPFDVISVIEKLFPNLKIAEGPGADTPKLDSTIVSSTFSSVSTESKSVKKSTAIILCGSPEDIAQAEKILTALDKPRKQVVIEVSIVELKGSSVKETGIDWSWNDVQIKEDSVSGIKFGKFTRTGMAFNGVVSAMLSDGSANLLAKPNISALDGESADILIGDRLLYPKLIGYNQLGSPIYDKAEEQVGIQLSIAVKINSDGTMLMTIYPRVSLVTSYLKTQAGDYPQISTREVKTTVSVKSGTTLAIGGLLRDDDIKSVSKIPLLSELPVLGQLFRHSKKNKERTEIVVFLTPKIVGEE